MKKISLIAILLVAVLTIFLIDTSLELGFINKPNTDEQGERTTETTESNVEQGDEGEELESQQSSEDNEVPESSNVTPLPEKESFLVVIDPGHQEKANLDHEPIGPGAKETKYKVTGGTTGVATGIPEYVLTLEASILLKRHLEEKGIQVILTRDSHVVDISNSERAAVANEHDADLFVRIHADGSNSPSTNGFSILVPTKDSPFTAPIYEDSYSAGQTIIDHMMSEGIALHGSGLFFGSDMSGFNWSEVPVILPEIGFMTNPDDDQKLADEQYLSHLMEILATGIEHYRMSEAGSFTP